MKKFRYNLLDMIVNKKANIALIGKMCAGKTSFAEYLVDRFDYKLLAFGDEVKHICELINGRPVNKAEDRTMLQQIGTIMRTAKIATTLEQERLLEYWKHKSPKFREYLIENNIYVHHSDFFVKMLDRKKQQLEDADPTACFVVHDCRYTNEYEYLVSEGFKIIKITCDENERLRRIANLYPNTTIENLIHDSETLLDTFKPDFEIVSY